MIRYNCLITLRFCLAVLLANGFFTFFPSTMAHGSSGDHMTSMGSHGDGERGRYSNPFWDPWSPYRAGAYDSAYSYTPTPNQQSTAKRQVETYLLSVKKGRKRAAAHRYISVETLRPTKQQLEDYTRKEKSTPHAEPAQLRCLMVFDTQTREFVGSGCYIVRNEPSAGEVARFEGISAEFVGYQTL